MHTQLIYVLYFYCYAIGRMSEGPFILQKIPLWLFPKFSGKHSKIKRIQMKRTAVLSMHHRGEFIFLSAICYFCDKKGILSVEKILLQ